MTEINNILKNIPAMNAEDYADGIKTAIAALTNDELKALISELREAQCLKLEKQQAVNKRAEEVFDKVYIAAVIQQLADDSDNIEHGMLISLGAAAYAKEYFLKVVKH